MDLPPPSVADTLGVHLAHVAHAYDANCGGVHDCSVLGSEFAERNRHKSLFIIFGVKLCVKE